MDDELLTVAEVAQRLKMNKQTIRNYIDAGSLPAVRIRTRRVRIRESDFDAFIQRRDGASPGRPSTSDRLSRLEQQVAELAAAVEELRARRR